MDLSMVGMAHCGTSFQGELAKSTSTTTFTNDLASVQASHKTWIFEVPVHDDVHVVIGLYVVLVVKQLLELKLLERVRTQSRLLLPSITFFENVRKGGNC